MEITNQGIPLGHRQTEIGVIPEDWDIKKFGELGTFYKGRGISMKDTVADGLPCIMYGDIYVKYNTKFSNPDFKITLETAARSTRARRGDLLFTASGETAEEIGKCVTYIGCEDIYIGGDIIGMTPNAGVEPLYLSYSQNSFPLLAQKANLGQGYTVVHISMDHIKSIKVALPPSTKEQSAIVTVLSDIDRLLIKLDTLIQKKKLIKQGAMQELLTGKRRLPGFQNAWITKPIKEIEAIPVSDGPHLTPRFIETGVPFFSVNNLVNNRISFEGIRYISQKDHQEFSKKCRPEKGDILLGKAASVGLVAVADLEEEFNVWSPIAVIRLKKKYNPYFFLYCFHTLPVLRQIKWLTNSSSQGNLGMSDIEKIEFTFPEKIEQDAIAANLIDFDQEIEQLESQLSKYQNIKQGMMQTLLTGKIRLL